jgi:hypothetical protein
LLRSLQQLHPGRTDVRDGRRLPAARSTRYSRRRNTVVATGSHPPAGPRPGLVTEVIIGCGRTKNLVECERSTPDGGRRRPYDTITANRPAPFWVSSLDRWVHAAELKAGYELETADHRPVTVVTTRT